MSQFNNILTRLSNSAVEAFNRREHLPKYLVVLPNEDFLVSLNFFAYGSSYLIGIAINWIAKQLKRMLDARAEDLHSKCPGAVFEGTCIIWIKMYPHLVNLPARSDKARIFSLRAKLNNAMEDLARKRKRTHILSVSSLEHLHFDQWGKLTYAGKMQFW